MRIQSINQNNQQNFQSNLFVHTYKETFKSGLAPAIKELTGIFADLPDSDTIFLTDSVRSLAAELHAVLSIYKSGDNNPWKVVNVRIGYCPEGIIKLYEDANEILKDFGTKLKESLAKK